MVSPGVLIAQGGEVDQASEIGRDLRQRVAPEIRSGAAVEFHFCGGVTVKFKIALIVHQVADTPSRTKPLSLFRWRKIAKAQPPKIRPGYPLHEADWLAPLSVLGRMEPEGESSLHLGAKPPICGGQITL